MNRTAVFMVGAMALLTADARGQVGDAVLEERIAECVQKHDGDCLERIAAFDEAAEAYETIANADVNNEDAEEAMLRGIRLRYALGRRLDANTAVQSFVKAFPESRRIQALAANTLSATDEPAQDPAEMAQHLGFYLRVFGTRGGWDRYMVAHARLGGLLMKSSCPVNGYFGACVEITKVRTECPRHTYDFPPRHREPGESAPKAPFYWGEVAKRHVRDAKQLREAKQHLKLALATATLRKAEKDAQGDVARLRRLANARGDALRLLATEEWDTYVARGSLPFDLDFTPSTFAKDACERRRMEETHARSSRRFMRWLDDKTRGAESLRDRYKAAISRGGPESGVAASAHMALVLSRFLEALDSGMQSFECHPDAFGGFVEPSDKLEPIEEKLVAAAERCEDLADTFAIGSDFAVYCRRQLWLLKPATYPRSVEMFLSQVQEADDLPAMTIPRVDSPPRLQPKPSRRPCKVAPEQQDRGDSSGMHLATIFGRDPSEDAPLWLPFVEDFLASMKERFALPYPGWR